MAAHRDMRALLGEMVSSQLDAATLDAAATMYPQMAPALAPQLKVGKLG